MAMLLKITVFLVCLSLICYGKDQSFDQSLEQIVTEEYWDELEEQDSENNGGEIEVRFYCMSINITATVDDERIKIVAVRNIKTERKKFTRLFN
ncbi:hypothetical protein ACROYT_G024699 [Oculina patagonica]